MNLKKRLFWLDSETSGVYYNQGYQILSLAIKVEDESNENVDSLSLNIQLKENSKVDKKSLEVNKINPYSENFLKNSLTYQDAYIQIKQFILKNYSPNSVNMAIAYKAQFDMDFLNFMFKSFGDNFSCLFDSVICPYPLAKKLTKENRIKTMRRFNEDGSSYRVCSLNELAITLNTKSKEDVAHTAMGDVKMMIKTVKKIWEIEYNQSIFANQDIQRFNQLQIYPNKRGF